jgi:hypothetical protein
MRLAQASRIRGEWSIQAERGEHIASGDKHVVDITDQ